MTPSKPLYWIETTAVLYLVTPLFMFFAFFIRIEIAIPACFLIAYLIYELTRLTSWTKLDSARWPLLYFLFLAATWVWMSGGIGPVHQNDDWFKHYIILNFLIQHPWPATDNLPNFGDHALRYYLGWYLIPALIIKAGSADLTTIATSIWSAFGVFLFFSLLPRLTSGNASNRRTIISVPLVFIAFAGADAVGLRITEFYYDWLYYFEWWAGWGQYSSNMTTLFFVPQHAIPAWLGVALLFRLRRQPAFLPYCGLLTSAVLLWSPFSAIGLVPFLVVLVLQHGVQKILLDWRAMFSAVLLAIPIGVYLTAGSENVPHGYIWTMPCLDVGYWSPCFTWPFYFLFLLVEIGAPLMILFLSTHRQDDFFIAAAVALCLIPLYKIGLANDSTMRVSLPSLAVLAIFCAKLFATGLKPFATAILLLLFAALPTTAGEIYRGFLPREDIPSSVTFDFWADKVDSRLVAQYFAPLPVWILREADH